MSVETLHASSAEGFIRCSRSDPNYNACLLNAMESSLGTLKNGKSSFILFQTSNNLLVKSPGIPSLNIPSIEPLKFDKLEINQGGNNARFNMKSSFKNVEITGFSTSKLRRAAIKFDKFSIKSELFTERLDFAGDYEMNGQILFLPITGAGRANVSMHQLTSKHELKGDYILNPKDNETYIKVTTYKMKLKPKWVTYNFANLFNGDKVLGQTMNDFMNQNWKTVFSSLVPEYEKFFNEKFTALSGKVFERIPMKMIFLD